MAPYSSKKEKLPEPRGIINNVLGTYLCYNFHILPSICALEWRGKALTVENWDGLNMSQRWVDILGYKRTITGPLASWGSQYKVGYSSMNVRVNHDYLLDLES